MAVKRGCRRGSYFFNPLEIKIFFFFNTLLFLVLTTVASARGKAAKLGMWLSRKQKVNNGAEVDPSVIRKKFIQSFDSMSISLFTRDKSRALNSFNEMWTFNNALCAVTDVRLFISDVLMSKFYLFIYLFMYLDWLC